MATKNLNDDWLEDQINVCQKYGLAQFMTDDSLPKDLLGAQGQLGGLSELAISATI